MAPHGEMSWTEGMIPAINPEVVAGIVSRISDLALIISENGTIRNAQANPTVFTFHPKTMVVNIGQKASTGLYI